MAAESVARKVAGSAKQNGALDDYWALRRDFRWSDVTAELDGLPGGGFNIAHEAVDRHAAGPGKDRVALKFIPTSGAAETFTYEDLSALSNRFAGVLTGLSVGKGDRVFLLADRIPELYIAALGTLKNLSVFCPMFSAFGPEPIETRMRIGGAKVLVTTDKLYRRKVASIRDRLPELEHILLVRAPGEREPIADTLDLDELLAAASPDFTVPPTDPEDPAILHFTSGTTGTPKGALHVHEAGMVHYATAKYALDLRPDDVFWCTADPGWVTGTSYGIVAPLMIGATMIVDQAEFEAVRWLSRLQEERVSVWYTAPTAIRMLMKLGPDAGQGYDLSALRFVASVGEPLNPEAVVWGERALGLPIRDNWWQTETGGIMIANFASTPIKPGSMGLPVPGIEAAIVHRDDNGLTFIEDDDEEGELVLKTGWPSMFRGYLGEDERYQRCFRDGWYLTGDLARRDSDGYFWFVGRADDVIKSAGHLIGPFEVESALIEHPAVAEAAVIGLPDPVSGQMVKGFVTLNPSVEPSPALTRDILGHTRKRLGAAIAPKEIEVRDRLPITKSGKIMRRLLRAEELGEPLGDTSTLEGS